jgi:hypothetical protein
MRQSFERIMFQKPEQQLEWYRGSPRSRATGFESGGFVDAWAHSGGCRKAVGGRSFRTLKKPSLK